MEASSESPKIKTWDNNSISLNIKEVAVDMVAATEASTNKTINVTLTKSTRHSYVDTSNKQAPVH